MEEILHQLIDGRSKFKPLLIYKVLNIPGGA